MNEVTFHSQGVALGAWHFAPRSTALTTPRGAPAVVMAHGLSMTRDSGLQPYAERFAEAGMHVLLFDYRGFGSSAGQPRELVSVRKQVEDYHAALQYARGLPGVDAQRIALWGTSYSGGIATQCAYEDGHVQALVLQVPNLDNAATGLFMTAHLARVAPVRGLWVAWRAVLDAGSALVGGQPAYVTAVGKSGQYAAYVNDESMQHVEQIRGPSWQNRLALRDFVRLPLFRPIRHIAQLPCRVQIFAADRDDLTPVQPALRAAKLLGARADLHRYPINHFGIYTGSFFEDAVQKQVAFLTGELSA